MGAINGDAGGRVGLSSGFIQIRWISFLSLALYRRWMSCRRWASGRKDAAHVSTINSMSVLWRSNNFLLACDDIWGWITWVTLSVVMDREFALWTWMSRAHEYSIDCLNSICRPGYPGFNGRVIRQAIAPSTSIHDGRNCTGFLSPLLNLRPRSTHPTWCQIYPRGITDNMMSTNARYCVHLSIWLPAIAT